MRWSLFELESILGAHAELLLVSIVETIDEVSESLGPGIFAKEGVSNVLKLAFEVVEHLGLLAPAEVVVLVLDLSPVFAEYVQHHVCVLGSTSIVVSLELDLEFLESHL